ncbi:hypothetical protein CC79DRAFT_1367887 [Sarocladium strictum]
MKLSIFYKRLKRIPLALWLPYSFFVIAAIATVAALHLHPPASHGRRLLFVPIFTLFATALFAITTETCAWSPQLLAHSLGVVCIGKLIALPGLLLASHGGPPQTKSLRVAWQTWNNPREFDASMMAPIRGDIKKSFALDHRLLFAAQRMSKVVALYLLDVHIIQKLIMRPVMLKIQLSDVGPDKEILLRRLLFSGTTTFSSFDVALRLLLPLQWLWWNFLYLERYHDCLAIIFVSILQSDSTESWPPLFGNITEAYSVKRFWGKFWHRIVANRLALLALPLSRHVFRCRPGSTLDKASIAFGIFLFSGLGHALVAWRAGEGHVLRDVFFYVANFGAATAEVVLQRMGRRWKITSFLVNVEEEQQRKYSSVLRLAVRALGYCWVYLWFVWVLPRWQFPKLRSLRQAQLDMEMSLLFGTENVK